jgi:hypothetical protein
VDKNAKGGCDCRSVALTVNDSPWGSGRECPVLDPGETCSICRVPYTGVVYPGKRVLEGPTSVAYFQPLLPPRNKTTCFDILPVQSKSSAASPPPAFRVGTHLRLLVPCLITNADLIKSVASYYSYNSYTILISREERNTLDHDVHFLKVKNVLPRIPCCGHCMSGSPMMQETVDSTMESPTITAVGDNGTRMIMRHRTL